jgi:hypothetical protein
VRVPGDSRSDTPEKKQTIRTYGQILIKEREIDGIHLYIAHGECLKCDVNSRSNRETPCPGKSF